MALAFVVSIQGSVLAADSQIAKNEAILSRFSTCAAANKAGYKNLKTRVGFKPKGAKRSFDTDKDGISCETK
jgi:Excalibur calcium-binding domain